MKSYEHGMLDVGDGIKSIGRPAKIHLASPLSIAGKSLQ
jgi:hypothetical protein